MSSPNFTSSKEQGAAKNPEKGAELKNCDNWFKNLDKFNEMLTLQESILEKFSLNLETNKPSTLSAEDYELAQKLAYKYLEDGNSYTSARKYQLAVKCYEQGLFLNYSNKKLRLDLLCQLSATQILLEDYRSCMKTVEQLLEISPNFKLGISRAITCCIKLKDFGKTSIYYKNYMAQFNGTPEEILEIKRFFKEIKELKLLNELNKRKLHVLNPKNNNIFDDLKLFDTKYPEHLKPVDLNNNRLVWSVIFMCTHYKLNIFVPGFHEDTLFYNKITDIFSKKHIWDIHNEYAADKLNVYYVFSQENVPKILKIESKTCSLSDALTLLRCPINYGIPTFLIFIAGGPDEKEALKDYTGYMRKIDAK